MTVTLNEAFRHGCAAHSKGWPWQIVDGKPAVGIPRWTVEGDLITTEEGFSTFWIAIPEELARKVFSKTGWTLLDSTSIQPGEDWSYAPEEVPETINAWVLYWREGLNLKEVASRMGVGIVRIKTVWRTNGFPQRTQGSRNSSGLLTEEQVQSILLSIQSGNSQRAVAKKFGISVGTVNRLVKEHLK